MIYLAKYLKWCSINKHIKNKTSRDSNSSKRAFLILILHSLQSQRAFWMWSPNSQHFSVNYRASTCQTLTICKREEWTCWAARWSQQAASVYFLTPCRGDGDCLFLPTPERWWTLYCPNISATFMDTFNFWVSLSDWNKQLLPRGAPSCCFGNAWKR